MDTSDNFYHKCIVNYPLSYGNQKPSENFFLKFDIIIKNNMDIQENIPFTLLSKVPLIIHDNENPLDIGLPIDELYYFDSHFYTTYTKFAKKIDYTTETLFSKETKNLIYFDEMSQITKIDKSLSLENPNVIGSFIIQISTI